MSICDFKWNSIYSAEQYHTYWNSRWSRCSAKMCELGSGDTADYCVHPPLAGNITPGEGQLGVTLR